MLCMFGEHAVIYFACNKVTSPAHLSFPQRVSDTGNTGTNDCGQEDAEPGEAGRTCVPAKGLQTKGLQKHQEQQQQQHIYQLQ